MCSFSLRAVAEAFSNVMSSMTGRCVEVTVTRTSAAVTVRSSTPSRMPTSSCR